MHFQAKSYKLAEVPGNKETLLANLINESSSPSSRSIPTLNKAGLDKKGSLSLLWEFAADQGILMVSNYGCIY
jgi:hypothetical protein